VKRFDDELCSAQTIVAPSARHANSTHRVNARRRKTHHSTVGHRRALKLVLEHREVSNWQKLVEHLLSDKEMLAGVRLKFRDLYREIEGSSDPSAALEALLGELPAAKKTH
jgi:hypothetical protein